MELLLAHRILMRLSSVPLWKWIVFVVLLPLLPVAARILAHWVNGGDQPLGFVQLFGDGELLVLAVVIAAAGIGDLVFDIRSGRRTELRDGLAISFAIVVVTLSALMFGFVTLKHESEGTLQATRTQNVDSLWLQAVNQSGVAQDAQAKYLDAQVRYQSELYGLNGNPPGNGFQAEVLKDAMSEAAAKLADNKTRLDQAITDARNATSSLALSTSETDASATASVVLFAISLIAGGLCLVLANRPSN